MPSRSRYSRARIRARARRPRRGGTSQWFYGVLSCIVVLGIVGIVLTRADSGSADVPPLPGNPATGEPGDHWHAAIGVNVCGEWLGNPAEFETPADNPNVRVGVHTHGDGFIHIHPFTRSEGGDNATVGRFLEYGGWSASTDSLDVTDWTVPPTALEKTWSNGDVCPEGTPDAGTKGVVSYDVDCKPVSGDPSSFKPKNGDVIAIGFRPKGTELGGPPNADSTPANDQGTEAQPLDSQGCSTAGPGGGTTTPTTATPGATTAPPASTP